MTCPFKWHLSYANHFSACSAPNEREKEFEFFKASFLSVVKGMLLSVILRSNYVINIILIVCNRPWVDLYPKVKLLPKFVSELSKNPESLTSVCNVGSRAACEDGWLVNCEDGYLTACEDGWLVDCEKGCLTDDPENGCLTACEEVKLVDSEKGCPTDPENGCLTACEERFLTTCEDVWLVVCEKGCPIGDHEKGFLTACKCCKDWSLVWLAPKPAACV